jgi:hypothetical protein
MREENEIKHMELYTKFIERYRNDIQKEKVERRDRRCARKRTKTPTTFNTAMTG